MSRGDQAGPHPIAIVGMACRFAGADDVAALWRNLRAARTSFRTVPGERWNHELFHSDTKFASHCGWPSFHSPKEDDAVELVEDRSLGMVRTEARCANCGSHLGHVFEGEGYAVPTDQRWCINSISLTLEPTE